MAGSVGFELDWLEAHDSPEPAIARTWAQLKLTGNGRTVTECADSAGAGTLRSHLFISPLPLAEWAVRHWYRLLDAPREPAQGGEAARAWRYRHAWRSGREGMAFPNLTTFRRGDNVHFEWSADDRQMEGVGVRFIGSGEVQMSRTEAEQTLTELVSVVYARLDSFADSRAEEFVEAWRNLGSMRPDKRRFLEMIARLGLDEVTLTTRQKELLGRLSQQGDLKNTQPILDALLDAAEPAKIVDDEAWAERVWSKCQRSLPTPRSLLRLRDRLAAKRNHVGTDRQPWRAGWDRAEALRSILPILKRSTSPAAALPRVLFDECGLKRSQIEERAKISDKALDGAVAWAPKKAPVFALMEPQTDNAKRFRLARDLHDVLFSGNLDSSYARVASLYLQGSLSVANAFAAELLAPVDAIRGMLEGNTIADEARVIDIARKLSVGPQVIRHQILNHELADLHPASLR